MYRFEKYLLQIFFELFGQMLTLWLKFYQGTQAKMQNYLYFIHCPIAFDREGHGEILEILLMIDLTRVKSNIP